MNETNMTRGDFRSGTESGLERNESPAASSAGSKKFRPALTVCVILGLSFLISRWAVWYGNEITLPRYCAEPEHTVASLRSVVNDTAATDNENRRAAMIAAKLLFLLPREPTESVDEYIARVRFQLNRRCQ